MRNLLLLSLLTAALVGCTSSSTEESAKVDPSASTPAPNAEAGRAKRNAGSGAHTGFGATSAAADLESRMGSAAH